MPKKEDKSAGAGEFTESLQLQALMLCVKALIATHPKPKQLEQGMSDLFAQFQATPTFQHLSASQRDWARELFSSLLPSSPSKD